MSSGELASERYISLKKQLGVVGNLPGFGEGEWLEAYQEAAKAVIEFVSNRPAMLVADSLDLQKILGFLQTEREEAERAEVDGGMKLYEELGDVGFFVLLTAMLYGDKLTLEDHQNLKEMMEYANTKGQEDGLDLPLAIMYVGYYKDTGNYPKVFYQLGKDETVETVPERIKQTVPAIREVREYLNGKWVGLGDDDLISTMRAHGEECGWRGDEAKAIRLLFGLAGIATILE